MAGHFKDEVKAGDDTQPLVSVSCKKVLKASTTLQNFLLQYEKVTPELLGSLRTIKDAIQLDLKLKKQTNYYLFIF